MTGGSLQQPPLLKKTADKINGLIGSVSEAGAAASVKNAEPKKVKTDAGAVTASPQPRRTGPVDEAAAAKSFANLRKRVVIQTWVIASLTLFLVLFLPFAQPIDLYYAIKPDGKTKQMVGLDMPNMTNRAILAWATTSITEIMTMGFGDIDVVLPKQKHRFTKAGWEAYNKAFIRQEIGQSFKKGQLVLTTVPSNTPVIVGQGVNLDDIYQWTVQMPVIMTYATNNNVMYKHRAIVTLTIMRVPAEENSAGIAIQTWDLM